MNEDPEISYASTFLHARREALLILLAWLVCLVWTVGYSALAGYNVSAEEMKLVLGMPAWVVWGVAMPWIAATLFSVWFGLFYMKNDALEEPAEAS
jgi:hypothetical protein